MSLSRADRDAFLECSQDQIEELYGDTLTINGTSYYVAVMEGEGTGTIHHGYENETRRLTFRVRKSLFPARPKYGAKVVYENFNYLITDVVDRPYDQTAYYVTCENLHNVE